MYHPHRAPRLIVLRWGDAAGPAEPGSSFRRRAVAWALRWLPIEDQL